MQNKEIGEEKSVNEKNVEVFNRYFPGCLSIENDNKLTLDTGKLKALLGDFSEIKEEGYGLDFVGKKIALNQAFKKNHKILKPLNESTSKHVLIKGDNLDALKILKQSYSEKIKMIYIDPPYNTKNENFIYGDDFSQSNEEVLKTLDYSKEKLDYIKNLFGSKCHSGWLSFMYPRLLLAKDLLKQDGVIFISIDDNECAQLKLLCDEIFGEGNFVACLKWKKKKQPSFLSKVAVILEYILVYAKDFSLIDKLGLDNVSDSDKPIINTSNNLSKRYFKKGIRVKSDLNFIKSGKYQNKTMTIEFMNDIFIENGRTKNDFECIGKFRTGQENINEFIEKDLIFITKNLGIRRDLLEEEQSNKKTITDLLTEWGQNQDATNELNILFNNSSDESIFSNPKPTKLINRLIELSTNEGDIILDFFAGSGTTAHAVLESNKSDYQKLSEGGGGYLMVTPHLKKGASFSSSMKKLIPRKTKALMIFVTPNHPPQAFLTSPKKGLKERGLKSKKLARIMWGLERLKSLMMKRMLMIKISVKPIKRICSLILTLIEWKPKRFLSFAARVWSSLPLLALKTPCIWLIRLSLWGIKAKFKTKIKGWKKSACICPLSVTIICVWNWAVICWINRVAIRLG
nr:site-specific DNA-methyltransferase (EC 2.1.1.-) HP1522 - Helicobacter pylori (strain 26695) [Helicobacter pylori]